MTPDTFSQLFARSNDERAARLEALWRMTRTQRIVAMRRGQLTMEQCCAWAARYPNQVPLIDGEFEFIPAYTPEDCE
jgi:hypothetical protein